MLTEQNIDKFIELRAQGWTLAHIATELHVSKRTLVDWNREYAADIQSLCALELELLQEKFLASREEELNRMLRLQKDVDDELANRCLKFVPIEKLFRLSVELRRQINQSRSDSGSEPPKPSPNQHRRNGHAHHTASPANDRMSAQPLDGDENNPQSLVSSVSSSAPLVECPVQPEKPSPDSPAPVASTPADSKPIYQTQAQTSPIKSPNPPQEREAERIVEASAAPNNPSEGSPEGAKLTQSLPQPQNSPQEHCLTCGAEAPALMPNGQRPNHYCKCGYPLPPPGTSLRETCYKCGDPLPVHGTNAQRHWDLCRACGAKLPPLDPKLPFPWVPPHQRAMLRQHLAI